MVLRDKSSRDGIPPRTYMLWVCPDCGVQRRGDGECRSCGEFNTIVPIMVQRVTEDSP